MELDLLIAGYQSGKTIKELAGLADLDIRTVAKLLKANGVTLRTPSERVRLRVGISRSQRAIEVLEAEGIVATEIDWHHISWTCHNQHLIQRQLAESVINGSRCIKCRRVGRTPNQAVKLDPGYRIGDIEVTKYLGVINNLSTVEVKNIVSGKVAVMSVTEFKSGRRQLLSDEEIRRRNIERNKISAKRGIENPKTLTTEEARCRGLEKGFELLSEVYTGSKAELLWRCIEFGHKTFRRFNNIDQGSRCSICSRKRTKSQKELYQFVLGMYPDALYNKSGVLKNKKFQLDVYIPSLKKAVELDGEYWHSLPGAPERDARKDKQCQEAGIELLRIGYLEHWHKELKDEVGKPMVLQFLTLSS